jgi:hypothetical protein
MAKEEIKKSKEEWSNQKKKHYILQIIIEGLN